MPMNNQNPLVPQGSMLAQQQVTTTSQLPPLPPVDTNPPVTTPALPPPLPPLVAETKEHVVVKNDSFFKLSKHYGVSLDAITKANPGVDSSRLKVGQKL